MGPEPAKMIKCVVWDLDDTLWEGVLAEGGATALRPGAVELIRTLDQRGILQSIASKNEPDQAIERVRQFGIEEYFLCPGISWRPKSELIGEIAQRLNIGTDTILFLDDSEFERAEVRDARPEVRCLDGLDLPGLALLPELNPTVTEDASRRRLLYRQNEQRQSHEGAFRGPRVEFLRSLDMRLSLAQATPPDLLRAAELTARTHQLNTTGLVFSHQQLAELLHRDDQLLLVAGLEDRFGPYGTVGVVLVGLHPREWRIRLLLMSCRVMGRNVGGAIITYLARSADERGVALSADFLPNKVNRPMYMVYRLAGFREVGRRGPVCELRLDTAAGRGYPDYVRLDLPSALAR
jgi:FkbH-like protein